MINFFSNDTDNILWDCRTRCSNQPTKTRQDTKPAMGGGDWWVFSVVSGDCQPLPHNQWSAAAKSESKMKNGKVKTKDDFSNLNFIIIPVLCWPARGFVVCGWWLRGHCCCKYDEQRQFPRGETLTRPPADCAREQQQKNGQEGKGVHFLGMDLNNDCKTKSFFFWVKDSRRCRFSSGVGGGLRRPRVIAE